MGFSNHIFKRKQITQLFPDIDITFDSINKNFYTDIFVVNALDGKRFDLPNGKFFILTNEEESRNFYFELLRKKGKPVSWFLYDNFCWITTL